MGDYSTNPFFYSEGKDDIEGKDDRKRDDEGGDTGGGTDGTTGTTGTTGGLQNWWQSWIQSLIPTLGMWNQLPGQLPGGMQSGPYQIGGGAITQLLDPAKVQNQMGKYGYLAKPGEANTFGSRSINLVDVRSPFMQGLEALSAPMLAGMLLQPSQTFQGMFGQQPAPPGQQGFDQNNPAYGAYQQAAAGNQFNPFLNMLLGQGGYPALPQYPSVIPGSPIPNYPLYNPNTQLPGIPSMPSEQLPPTGTQPQPTPSPGPAPTPTPGPAPAPAPSPAPGGGEQPPPTQSQTPPIPGFAGNPAFFGGNQQRMVNEILLGQSPFADITGSMWTTPFTMSATGDVIDPRAAKGVQDPTKPTSDTQAAQTLFNEYQEMANRFNYLNAALANPSQYGTWSGQAIAPEQFQGALDQLTQYMTGKGFLQNGGLVAPYQPTAEDQRLAAGATQSEWYNAPPVPVRNYQTGGILDPNALNIVGEQGPEAIVGNQVLPLQSPPNLSMQGIGVNDPNPYPDPTQQATGQMGGLGGVFTNLLASNPELQTFNQGNQLLNENFFQQNPGQGIMDALQPVFQRNLSFGLGELANRAPSVSNSALQLEGTDLARQAIQDFNLLGAQSLQQGLNQQLSGLQTLGGLAGQAGQNPFERALGLGNLGLQRELGLGNLGLGQQQLGVQQQLGLGNLAMTGRGQDIQNQQALLNLAQQQQQFGSQYGLAQNQQAFNQTILPALQLLQSLIPMLGPTGFQTVAMGG